MAMTARQALQIAQNMNPAEMATTRELLKEALSRQQAGQVLERYVEHTKPDWQTAKHHQQIFDALAALERGEITRLIIEAPPRHSKSETASRRFPAYCMGRTAGLQVVCSTYNQDFANDLGRDVRSIIGSDEHAQVFPECTLRRDSKAADRFHTTNGGIYVAVGTGSALTGRGMDIGIIDDPFKDREEAESERTRQRKWDWFRSTFYTRQMPNARLLVMATRWHEDDLTGRILEHEGDRWHRLHLPAISDEGQASEEALWDEWYPLETLYDIRKTIGARDWLSLYQQSPTSEEGTIFQRDWFTNTLYKRLPEELNYFMSGDFAVTEGGGDFTELALWGVSATGHLYAVDWWYGQTTADVWVEQLLNMCDTKPVLAFIGETGQIRRAIEPMIIRRMRGRESYTQLIWLPHGAGSKQANCRSFQAMASMGRVHFPRDEIWAERIIDQLLKFPDGRLDDGVDTTSLIGRYMDKAHDAVIPRQKENNSGIISDGSAVLRVKDFHSKKRKKSLY